MMASSGSSRSRYWLSMRMPGCSAPAIEGASSPGCGRMLPGGSWPLGPSRRYGCPGIVPISRFRPSVVRTFIVAWKRATLTGVEPWLTIWIQNSP